MSEEKIPYRFIIPLMLGAMMNPLNSTMLATALVTLCKSYKISPGDGAILITSLYITSTIAQPLMGRLADMFSAKKINTLGFILVLIASALGVWAPSFGSLIASRIILGLGTSAAYPSAMALINKKYAAENKPVPGKVLGLIVMAAQLSMVLGPVLGGALTQWMGWKGVFFINIPFIAIAMFLSRYVPDYPVNPENQGGSLVKRLDIVGIIFFTAFLLSLLFMLMAHPFDWLRIIPPIVLLLALILWERGQERPFIDVRLFVRNPMVSLIYLRTLAITYILYMMLYGMPQWIESVKHVKPGITGMLMMPNSIMSILLGLWVSRTKNVFFQNLAGTIVLLAACAGLFYLHEAVSFFFIIGLNMIMGSGEGINVVANQALMNEEAPAAQKGVSFGLIRTFGYLGAIISSSQLKVIFRDGVTDEKFHDLSSTVFYSCVVVLLLLLPLWKRRKQLA
jgi:MFS family permease